MLALQKTRPGSGIEFVEAPLPQPPGAGEVIVEVSAAGICGSDLHIDRWDDSYAHLAAALPMTLGHEFAGRVVEAGAGVAPQLVGQRVVVVPAYTCGACAACLAGNTGLCTKRRAVGVNEDGAFASRLKVRASQCLPLADHVEDRVGALAEPLVVSLNAVKIAGVAAGDRVLVFGPGTIGQGAALLARRAGAREVVVVGMNDPARFAALAEMGFDRLIDLADAAPDAVRDAAGSAGFDVVIEASGSPRAFNDGLRLLRMGGTLCAVGIYAKPVEVNMTDVVRRRLSIHGSARAEAAIWTEVMAILAEDPGLYAKMISHDLPLSRAMEGFELGHARKASKVVLHPNGGV